MKSVFISSTFKDMQAERDLLHEAVFPRLRKVMAEYGEDIQELDLRWGVDTANMSEEESGQAVLKVCIDAIDRCKPFFIVLLGERYGWIPGTDIVESVRDERISRYYEDGMSITNLEILYGALAREDLFARCIFCFRNPAVNEKIEPEYRGLYEAESDRHREHLLRLKKTIREKEGAVVFDYRAEWDDRRHQISGLEEFGETVCALLTEMIRAEYAGQQPGSTEEHLIREMQQTKERYLSSYIHRPMEELQILEPCVQFLRDWRDENRKRLFVKAAAGTGKSALMAACAKALEGKEEKGWHSILYFAGNPGCQDKKMLKQVLRYRLEEILGQSHEVTQGSLEDRLNELNEKIGEKRIVCFLDAAEQLTGEDRYLDVLSLCSHVYYVISALPSFSLEAGVTGSGMEFITVTPGEFTSENIRRMTNVTVSRRGKKLDDVVSEAVQQKKGSGNPLYLSMLLQRLFMMDGEEFEAAEAMAPGMEGLHRYMMRLIAEMPEEPAGMVRYLLEETGKHFGAEEFSLTAALLAQSREGLTEQELEAIFAGENIPFSQIRFQQIVSYLYDGFSQRQDGKWNFAHRLFGEAVKENYPEECRLAEEYLIAYARRNPAFLAREGYEYLLKGRHPDGLQVLEQKMEDREQKRLGGLVGSLLRESAEYRAYFAEMAQKNGSSEELIGFWNEFFEEPYGEDAVQTVREIRDCFLQDPACPPKARCECCLKMIEMYRKAGEWEKTAEYQKLAEELAEQVEGDEGTLVRAGLLLGCADSEDRFGRMEEAQRLRRQALTVLGAMREAEDAEMREKAAGMSGEAVCNILWSDNWLGNVMEPELAEEALQELRSCGCDRAESRYAWVCIRLFGVLVTIYTDGEHFDIEKAVVCGEEGIALARACVERNPSTGYLYELSYILEYYRRTRRMKYRYPYSEECMLTRKRILEREQTYGNRVEFANAARIFAMDADRALESDRDDLPRDLRERADRCWEESLALYGMLLEEGMSSEDMTMYRYGLFARADVMADRRRYEDAIRYIRMGQSMLPEECAEESRNQFTDLIDQFHARRLLAEVYLAIFREEEALQEAEAGLLFAGRMAEQYPSKLGSRLATAYGLLAEIHYRQHNWEEALTMCEKAREAWLAFAGETGYSWKRAELDYICGRICLEQGDTAGAREWDQKAFGRAKEATVKKTLRFEEELFLERRWILYADILMAEEDYREAKAQWEKRMKKLKAFQKKVQEWEEGENAYLLAMLDVLTGYVYRRFGDALRQGGLVKDDGFVDVKDEKFIWNAVETGGEIEYVESYQCYRAWIGTYDKTERSGREVFALLRAMVLSLPDNRRCYAVRMFAEMLVKAKKELYPWEKAFFRELLSGCDMCGVVSPEFWQLAVLCVDAGSVEEVLPVNREGIGHACFADERLRETLRWMETVPAPPDSAAEITCALARCQLALREGKELPADRQQLERMAQLLSKQTVTSVVSCQICVCYELLATVTEGKEQAEYIEQTFGMKWGKSSPMNHYHSQHLRMLPLILQVVEEGRYTKEQTEYLWSQLFWSAELRGKEGGFHSVEEKTGIWVSLIHTFAPRLLKIDEQTVVRGIGQLWKILTEEDGAWETALRLLTNEDIELLLWRWETTRGGGRISNWHIRTRLGLELYARTGDRKWITELMRENRSTLSEYLANRWYVMIAEEREEIWATAEKLAENLLGLLRRVIAGAGTDAERDFWIDAAMEEFRLGALPDGLSKEALKQAADELGEYRPECREELLQLAEDWEDRRLELLTEKFCAV